MLAEMLDEGRRVSFGGANFDVLREHLGFVEEKGEGGLGTDDGVERGEGGEEPVGLGDKLANEHPHVAAEDPIRLRLEHFRHESPT